MHNSAWQWRAPFRTRKRASARCRWRRSGSAWRTSRTEAPISQKDRRHHPATDKSNRSFNNNSSRFNPRTTTRRNKPPPSPRGGRAPTYLDDDDASIGGALNASRSRTFAPPLRSSSRFPCRPRTAFGTPAACRNGPAPASRLPALGPTPRCRTLQWARRRAPRRGQFRTANGPSRPPTNGGAAQILYSKTGPREIQKAGSKRRCLRAFMASKRRAGRAPRF